MNQNKKKKTRRIAVALLAAFLVSCVTPLAAQVSAAEASETREAAASTAEAETVAKDTEKPADTEKPEETEKSEETEKPEDTEKPADTEKPEDTEKPKETEPQEETPEQETPPKKAVIKLQGDDDPEPLVPVEQSYVIEIGTSGLVCRYNGEPLTNVWLAIVQNVDAYTVAESGETGAKLYYFDEQGVGTLFTGLYDEKYYASGVLGTGAYQDYYYKDGVIHTSFTGVYQNKYYKSGKLGTASSAYYINYSSYVYKVNTDGSAEKYVKDSAKTGTYAMRIGGVCYNIEYNTGKVVSRFTGVAGNKYFKAGVLGTASSAYFINYSSYVYKVNTDGSAAKYVKDSAKTGTYAIRIDGVCYNVEYKTGKVTGKFTGVAGGKYYKAGALGTASKVYYINYSSYIYKVNTNGTAAKYVKDSSKSGTYAMMIGSVCYNVEYKTGKVTGKFTGVAGGKYYKAGALGTASKVYYIKYSSYIYKVNTNGTAAKHVKDSSKSGTYAMLIGSVCYNVEYKTGKVTGNFTGVSGNRYYVNGVLSKKAANIVFNGKRYKVTSTGAASLFTGFYSNKFYKAGVLQKNQIVTADSKNYYYVDSTGTRVTDATVRKAVAFVRAHGKGTTAAQKLRSCYFYLIDNYKYIRCYGIPKAADMPNITSAFFDNKGGNCFRFASAFAYIARVLGYDSKVCTGQIEAAAGGVTPHGWTEVKSGGKWYLCDADMQQAIPSINVYMVLEKDYAYYHYHEAKYALTIANGKVTWK